MLRNYIRSAWRQLKREKLSSCINLLGLVLGVSSTLLIMMYVHYELSYDNYHQHANRIVRITTQLAVDGKEDHSAWAPNFIGEQVQSDYPEVESIIRLQANQDNVTFSVPLRSSTRSGTGIPQSVSLEQVYNVYDADFFKVFTYPMLEGDPRTALTRPGSVVITEYVARKLFGPDWQKDKGVLGETVQSGGNRYQITGVIQDVPYNTDMPFQALLKQDAGKLEKQAWCMLYILFTDAMSGVNFPEKLAMVTEKIQPDFAKKGGHITFNVEKLRDVHLGTPKTFDTPKANRSYLIIFSLMAGLLLLIASINYINLSLAQSLRRSREVGVRKAIGATHSQLLIQFLGESFLLILTSLLISLLLVTILLPVYNNIAGTHFSFVSLLNWQTLGLLLGIYVIIGIVAGSYPAFYLASLKPTRALNNAFRFVGRSAKTLFGRGLIVVQFTISIAIIVSALTIYRQLHYIQHKNLGFQREQVLVLDIPKQVITNGAISTLKKVFSSTIYSHGVALSGFNSLPGQDMNLSAFNLEKDGKMLALPQQSIDVDANYLNVLTIPLTAGKNFTVSEVDDAQTNDVVHEIIVNEALVKKMEWKSESVIGKRLSQGIAGEETWHGKVVGVVRDFHFQSPQKPIVPMVLLNTANQFPEKMLIRLSAEQLPKQISLLKTQWQEIVTDYPFDYSFLDVAFEKQYRQEQRLVSMFTCFSLLTILVACLGMYGLSAYATAQRTKEVGVRKIMGATEGALIYLLSREFLLLVGFAIILACPLAWFAMNRWLQDYAYRISISPLEFLIAGGGATFVAALATGYHAVYTARTNPVRALRNE